MRIGIKYADAPLNKFKTNPHTAMQKYADWGKVCGFAVKQVQNQKANPHTMRIGVKYADSPLNKFKINPHTFNADFTFPKSLDNPTVVIQ